MARIEPEIKQDLQRQVWLAWDGADRVVLGLCRPHPALPPEVDELTVIVTACSDSDEGEIFSVVDMFCLRRDGFIRPIRVPKDHDRIEVSVAEIQPARKSDYDFRIEGVISFTLDRNPTTSDGARIVSARGPQRGQDLLGVEVAISRTVLKGDVRAEFTRNEARGRPPTGAQSLVFALALPWRDVDAGEDLRAVLVGPCETIHPGPPSLISLMPDQRYPETPSPPQEENHKYALWSHTHRINPKVSFDVRLPADLDGTTVSDIFIVQVLMQRRLAAWWEDGLRAANELRRQDRPDTFRAGDSLVQITLDDLWDLPIALVDDLRQSPFEAGESIVAVPFKEDPAGATIRVGTLSKGDGGYSRRIDVCYASRGDYVAVVDRYRKRLATSSKAPCSLRAFKVGHSGLVPVDLADDIREAIERHLSTIEDGSQAFTMQSRHDRDAMRAVIDDPVTALTRLAYRRAEAGGMSRLDVDEDDPSAAAVAATGAVAAVDASLRAEMAGGIAASVDADPRFASRVLARAGHPELLRLPERVSLAVEFNLFRLYGEPGNRRMLETLLSAAASYEIDNALTFGGLRDLVARVTSFQDSLKDRSVMMEVADDTDLKEDLDTYERARRQGTRLEARAFLDLLNQVEACRAAVAEQHMRAKGHQRSGSRNIKEQEFVKNFSNIEELRRMLDGLVADAARSDDIDLVSAARDVRNYISLTPEIRRTYLTDMIFYFKGHSKRADRQQRLDAFCQALCNWAGIAHPARALTFQDLLKLFAEGERCLDGTGIVTDRRGHAAASLEAQVQQAGNAAEAAFRTLFDAADDSFKDIYLDVGDRLQVLVGALALHRAYGELNALRGSVASVPPPDLERRMRLWPCEAVQTWDRHVEWARKAGGGSRLPALPSLAEALAQG